MSEWNNNERYQLAFTNGVIIAMLMFFLLWVLTFAGSGVHYPSGEPVTRTFDPVASGALSVAAAAVVIILQLREE